MSPNKEIGIGKIERNQIIRVFIYLIIVWLIAEAGVLYINPEWEARGQFGDMFGFINSLFSGLAFIGVIIAIYLQSKELGLQRDELKANRKEMAQQSFSLEKQSELMLRQQLDSIFFQLIRYHKEESSTVSVEISGRTYLAREAFNAVINTFYLNMRHSATQNKFKIDTTKIECIRFIHSEFTISSKDAITPTMQYLRSIKSLILFLNRDEVSIPMYSYYMEILKNQFTDNEREFIFFLTETGIFDDQQALHLFDDFPPRLLKLAQRINKNIDNSQ